MQEDRKAPATKAAYETPVLTRLGSFEELTQGQGTGDRLDANFPVSTPHDNFLFHFSH